MCPADCAQASSYLPASSFVGAASVSVKMKLPDAAFAPSTLIQIVVPADTAPDKQLEVVPVGVAQLSLELTLVLWSVYTDNTVSKLEPAVVAVNWSVTTAVYWYQTE